MSGHTYKIVEIVGSSREGIEGAIESAISRASNSIHNLEWFEVREIRGTIAPGGSADWYQVKVGLGFRVEGKTDVSTEEGV